MWVRFPPGTLHFARCAKWKHQTPNSKPQRSFKSQTPNLKCSGFSRLANWSLVIGIWSFRLWCGWAPFPPGTCYVATAEVARLDPAAYLSLRSVSVSEWRSPDFEPFRFRDPDWFPGSATRYREEYHVVGAPPPPCCRPRADTTQTTGKSGRMMPWRNVK